MFFGQSWENFQRTCLDFHPIYVRCLVFCLMWLLIDDVPVERVVWVLLLSDGAPFEPLLVVILLVVLKELVEPVRLMICVE